MATPLAPWSAPMTATAGAVYTAGEYNTHTRDNTLHLKTSVDDNGAINFVAATEKTIATGAITVDQNMHTVDTEGDAASDDLDTINWDADAGADLITLLRAENAARVVTVKDGTGNIKLADDEDFVLDDADKVIALIRDGSNALELWRRPAPSAATPAGVLNGLVPSNGTDADHDIDLTAGEFYNRTTGKVYAVPAFTKRIDAAISMGDNAGGMFTGTVAADTIYHLILIVRNSDGVVDWGFDTSPTGANAPAGWTARGRFGAVLTDGSSNILAQVMDPATGFVSYGRARQDVADSSGTLGVFETGTLSVPNLSNGVVAAVFGYASLGGTGTGAAIIRHPDSTNASTSEATILTETGSPLGAAQSLVLTDSSGQIEYTLTGAGTSWAQIIVRTAGYFDPRGRDQ